MRPPWPRRLALAASVLAAIGLLLPLGHHPQWQLLLNLAHLPAFTLLAWLWTRALRAEGQSRVVARNRVLAVGLPLGVLGEALQAVVPGRWLDPLDLIGNLLGIALGAWLASRR